MTIKILLFLLIILIGTFLLVIRMAFGLTAKEINFLGEEYINKQKYNAISYSPDLKNKMFGIIDIRNVQKPNYDDGQIWVNMIGNEIQKCGNWILTNITESNLLDKLNEKLKLGTC